MNRTVWSAKGDFIESAGDFCKSVLAYSVTVSFSVNFLNICIKSATSRASVFKHFCKKQQLAIFNTPLDFNTILATWRRGSCPLFGKTGTELLRIKFGKLTFVRRLNISVIGEFCCVIDVY